MSTEKLIARLVKEVAYPQFGGGPSRTPAPRVEHPSHKAFHKALLKSGFKHSSTVKHPAKKAWPPHRSTSPYTTHNYTKGKESITVHNHGINKGIHSVVHEHPTTFGKTSNHLEAPKTRAFVRKHKG